LPYFQLLGTAEEEVLVRLRIHSTDTAEGLNHIGNKGMKMSSRRELVDQEPPPDIARIDLVLPEGCPEGSKEWWWRRDPVHNFKAW